MVVRGTVSAGGGVFIVLGLACGGSVVVDPVPGSGGAGGAASSGITSSSSVGSGAGGQQANCDELGQSLTQSLAAAQACEPAINSLQCSGTAVAFDMCSCPVAINEKQLALGQLAREAFQAWAGAGCGPVPCFECPDDPTEAGWRCDVSTKQCQPPQ